MNNYVDKVVTLAVSGLSSCPEAQLLCDVIALINLGLLEGKYLSTLVFALLRGDATYKDRIYILLPIAYTIYFYLHANAFTVNQHVIIVSLLLMCKYYCFTTLLLLVTLFMMLSVTYPALFPLHNATNVTNTVLMYISRVFLVDFVANQILPFVSKCINQPASIVVNITEDESNEVLVGKEKFDPSKMGSNPNIIYNFDPSTYDKLGETAVMSEKEVNEIVRRSRVAQETWKTSSFATREKLLRVMLRYIIENQEVCARVAVRDSGKTFLDAMIGEVLVTCEKLTWLADHGKQYLQREYRDTGRMMMMKRVYVDYIPLGVIGAIVPWNYPFHNIFNPVSAALFSGNSIVIKVSEFASWSPAYYKRIIDAALDSVGAPRDLVQIVYGYGPTGAALVKSKIDKLIFVGSPEIGKIVAKAASDNFLPVVLELGGKDPFVIADDVNIDGIVQTACRGVWQSMGQNCAGPERFFVYEKVYDEFCDKVTKVVKTMRQGPSNGDPFVDCGAICMGPKQLLKYQDLVDDAVAKGARVLHGGEIPKKGSALANGCFYPPTILVDVSENAKIAQEEIFGPIMCVFKVKGNSDSEAIRMANNCEFALSSCAFSGNYSRARKLAAGLTAGMSAVNDLEGCTYMSQSLPFGGCKKSGYDRFAGPEGLRGLCMIRSVCEDAIPFITNAIPPPMQYPATGIGAKFASGLIYMFYGPSLADTITGIWRLIYYSIYKPAKK